jgi:hypothetical protein
MIGSPSRAIDFAAEKTLVKLTAAGFRNSMEGASLLQRVTHPGKGPYPDATFDYLFGSNLIPGKPQITASKASDHYPVTCDFSLGGSVAESRSQVQTPAATTPAPAPAVATTTAPAPAQPSTPQYVTLTQPVKIKIPYGETVLPRGLKLAVLSRDAQTVTVNYLERPQVIPISATDLH